MHPSLAELPARSNTPFAPIYANPSEPTMPVARRYSPGIIPDLWLCRKLPEPTEKSPATAAQQHQTDTEMQAVRAVRTSNETHSCPAHNGVAMGA